MVFAYLDIASGGMIAAAAAGGVAGLRAMARSAWTRRGASAPIADPETDDTEIGDERS